MEDSDVDLSSVANFGKSSGCAKNIPAINSIPSIPCNQAIFVRNACFAASDPLRYLMTKW